MYLYQYPLLDMGIPAVAMLQTLIRPIRKYHAGIQHHLHLRFIRIVGYCGLLFVVDATGWTSHPHHAAGSGAGIMVFKQVSKSNF